MKRQYLVLIKKAKGSFVKLWKFLHIEDIIKALYVEKVLWFLHLIGSIASLTGGFMLLLFGKQFAKVLPLPSVTNFALLYTLAGACLLGVAIFSLSVILYKVKEKQLVIKKLRFMTIENILHVLQLEMSVIGLFGGVMTISIFGFYTKYETEMPFANLIAIAHLIVGCLILVTSLYSFSAMIYKKSKDGLTEEDEAYWDEYFGNN